MDKHNKIVVYGLHVWERVCITDCCSHIVSANLIEQRLKLDWVLASCWICRIAQKDVIRSEHEFCFTTILTVNRRNKICLNLNQLSVWRAWNGISVHISRTLVTKIIREVTCTRCDDCLHGQGHRSTANWLSKKYSKANRWPGQWNNWALL